MKKFEHDLSALKQRVLDMGDLAAGMIEMVVHSLKHDRDDVTPEIQKREHDVNLMQLEIDRDAIRLHTVYGPVASDLRFVLMVSKINTELERIADQAVNMCEFHQLLVLDTHHEPLPEFSRMGELVMSMLNDSMQAFLYEDRELAESIILRDDHVDALNNKVLLHGLKEPPEHVAHAVAEILLSRSLERIADQTTNICEEVVYIVSGEDIRHPK